jgi:hypothetical protein
MSKSSINNPAEKFAKFQLSFLSKGITDKYLLAKDSLLTSYFLDFNTIDLLRVRHIIKNRIDIINKDRNYYNISAYDYKYSAEQRAYVLKKMEPLFINDPSFCLSFGSASTSLAQSNVLNMVPKAFDGSLIRYDAASFLEVLRISIDLTLVDKNPESLVQVLKDIFPYRKFNAVQNPDSWIKQLSDESEKLNREFRIKYRNPKNQYFSKNKEYGSLIFKLLASLSYCDDVNSLEEKSYFLNRAAEFGDNEALLNLASLFQTYYYNTKNSKYNDSCIFYLEKAIKLNLPEAFALKGIKVFNGEGYIKNKDEGVKLLIKAKSLNSETALILLETFPKNHLDRLKEGYYFNELVKLTYPWDFKVKCSNNCGKYTYPKEIIYGRYYDEKGSENMPQIKYSDFFFDNTGNPKINISYNDFRKTFSIAYLGFEYWKHVMCSATCQLAHENKNNSNFNAIKNKRNQIDNELIKCVSCSKSMKRKDMVTIPDCPCYNEFGGSIGISFTQPYDLHGDNEPKACSSQCQINFCKTKCASKGYTSKY